MSAGAPDHRACLAAYEQGQERLRDAMLAACRKADVGLPAQVDAALGSALSLLASDVDLAYLLAAWPDHSDSELWRPRWEWLQRYGALLRDAAARHGAPGLPFFLEPTLIGGIAFQVGCCAAKSEADRIERLLPAARWYLLSYYHSPDEMPRLGLAA